ncbi:ABC transporter ATP-binding protein/permease [Paenibacillus sp. HN-1]|uniref:ABC transporter ATP-binding protein/permease n=1 Tax=Paenibacillus TaxID=44249 RepID=UPI001CA97FB1|nr:MULTISPECIES: ABC transporter ATP-binding protein/permease [Paenibacillus]MBY9082113.1 ABC transporter ATP-binding protein/permease [Paenibacillus sp. CGMCC 1.18879]MBY9082691.1 ABC transporter ATP-binding protein/permease [Paenibacillus sinensis]
MDKNLLGYKGVKPVFVAVGFLTLVQSLSILLLAKSLAEVISALFAGDPLKEQWGTALLFLLAFLVRHACGQLMSGLAYRFAEKTSGDMRRRMMEKLFRLGPRMAGDQGTGTLVTLALEGVTKFRTYLELIIPRMVGMGVTPWVLLLYVFLQDKTSGIILTLTMPIIVVFMILIGTTAQKHMDRQLASYRTLSNHFVDSLRGLETLKFLGRSKSHKRSIAEVSDRYRSATMKTLRVAFLSSFALDFFTMLSVASVAVSLGLRLVNSEMTLVTGLTILIIAPEYFLPVRLVGADFHATLDGKEAGEKIKSIIDKETVQASLIGEKTAPVQAGEAGAAAASGQTVSAERAVPAEHAAPAEHEQAKQGDRTESSGAIDGTEPSIRGGKSQTGQTIVPSVAGAQPALPTAEVFTWNNGGTLSLNGIGLRHEEDGPASLIDVHLQFAGTGKIGIIGESGAGKSTLIDILAGFLHPGEGMITINGQAVSGLTDDAWRRQASYIPQRPYIFSGTLADNVRFYHPEASIEAVEGAVAAAGLAPLAASLPGGLNEPIGGGGRRLSGGQEQRVALSRALLSDRPIMLLDEPTAHLDIETEYELKETMLPLFEGKLVFLATHRLHWMADMDQIIVMKQGRVAEVGTHQELLERKGAYYELAMAQLEAIG